MWRVRRACAVVLVVAFGACSDGNDAVTKGDLADWLENGNSDAAQADPRCVLDHLWDAGLSDAELRDLIDDDSDEAPSRSDVYVAIRDECNTTQLADECRSGERPLIECRGLEHPDA